jgi:hypothetical protein
MKARRESSKTKLALPLLVSLIATGTAMPKHVRAELGALADKPAVIVVTDLYHPFQDQGDNLDAITAFGLPDIDLRAVILDVTEDYLRRKGNPLPIDDAEGAVPRDPGFVPIQQLNWIFDRTVPTAAGVFTRMRSVTDTGLDAPRFQQAGVELLLRTLRESPRKVEIFSTGSARVLALAFNREPATMATKVARIHLSAGSSDPSFVEWNVHLDPLAMISLLHSNLPIVVYPCGTAKGAYDLGKNNTYWSLPSLSWVKRLPAPLVAYVAYALNRTARADFLAAMDEQPDPASLDTALSRTHAIWETAPWMQIARKKLVRHAAGDFEIVSESGILPTDTVLQEELFPAQVTVNDNGTFQFARLPAGAPTNFLVYERADPLGQQEALRSAYPRWLETFQLPHRPPAPVRQAPLPHDPARP